VVLFAVLLTRPSGDQTTPGGKPARTSAPHYVVSAVLAGIAVGAVLTLAIQATPLAERKTAEAPSLSVKEIGEQLSGPHAVALLAIGVLLAVALIGAMAIAATQPRRKEP
jgi:NADH:ubiquinone oxidoreductase subunit 6 (subunit J)